MAFVHLHVHSHLSLLDSTIRVPDLAKRVHKLGMSAVALTDHGNLFAGVQLLTYCKKEEVKPIFGSEINLWDPKASRIYHLVLLARTEAGFGNLRAIISKGYLEGKQADGTPTVQREFLAEHAGGLFALSACLGGEVPQALLKGDEEAARDAAVWYDTTFGHGNFYLELQGNGLAEQEDANNALIDLGNNLGIPLVATNNAHYLTREDAQAHAVLVAIEMKRTLTLDQIRNLPLTTFHLATEDEMRERFAHVPEALDNTVRIAEAVEGETLKTTKKLHFPIFRTPAGEPVDQYLRDLADQGLSKRLEEDRRLGRDPDEKAYRERLDRELGVIIKLGFDAYYLTVWDFINWSKANGVPVGPGRGSGAGSLAAYAIGITDIDPMKFDLLFERFLNPERVSPPDFDVDFCMAKRGMTIQYVTAKYGRDHVSQIITFGALKAKAAVKDVGRVLGLTFAQGDQISKLIPQAPDMTLETAWTQEPRLPELINSDPLYKEVWEIARKVEGLNRQPGMHAAGVVIADRPVADYAPVYVDPEGAIVTQFNMKDLDSVGLIKFDFLGLTALTVTENAVDIIRSRGHKDFRIEDVPIDDKETFEVITAGGTAGVFQLETRGITELVRKMRPDCIEDIIAVIALFRPGPLKSGMVDDFIDRKHGVKAVEYLVPELEPILKDTYGTILYQEQIMLIARVLAGFSLGGADLLRRAMGKKDMKVLEAQREPFMKGAAERNIDLKKAEEIFGIMANFAEYGFNKSHSAAYALVTYRMAYLKAHFPTEFLCAVLTAEKGDQPKVMRFIKEARDAGVPVLPPSINHSESDFSVQDVDQPDGTRKGGIRFGLTAVKGIGESAVEAILAARKDGPFTSVTDFMARVDLRKVNKRVIEQLARCGALDGFGHTRASIVEGLDILMDQAEKRRTEKESGQFSMFDLMAPASRSGGGAVDGPPPVPEWPWRQLLAFEKDAIGYYVTGHPMDPYQGQLKQYEITSLGDLPSLSNGAEVAVAGIVVQANEKTSKAGQRMVFLTLEDFSGQVEVAVFSRVYPQWEALGRPMNEPVLVRGRVDIDADDEQVRVKVLSNSLEGLDAARRGMVRAVRVRVDLGIVREATIDRLRDVVKAHKGNVPLELVLKLAGVGELHLRANSQWHVDPGEAIVTEIEKLTGPGTVTIA